MIAEAQAVESHLRHYVNTEREFGSCRVPFFASKSSLGKVGEVRNESDSAFPRYCEFWSSFHRLRKP